MVGQIVMFAGRAAPSGWLLCDGTAVSRATYGNLFNVIGEDFGAGDGVTTFNLPNFTDRFPVGPGTEYATEGVGMEGGTVAHRHGTSDGNLIAEGTTEPPSASASARSVDSDESVAGSTHVHSIVLTISGTTDENVESPVRFLGVNFIIEA